MPLEEAFQQDHAAECADGDRETKCGMGGETHRHGETEDRVAARFQPHHSRMNIGQIIGAPQAQHEDADDGDRQDALQHHTPVTDSTGCRLRHELLAGGAAGTEAVKSAHRADDGACAGNGCKMMGKDNRRWGWHIVVAVVQANGRGDPVRLFAPTARQKGRVEVPTQHQNRD